MTIGWQSRLYLWLRRPLQPLMRRVLRQRVARGKEIPGRSGERLGNATASRPEGPLVWLNAVGLGEVLALRPLILRMQAIRPELNVLVTSTARASAQVIETNLPPRCLHQFLPMDGTDFVAAFLNHWRPDLVVWSEQELWPGATHDCARRGIPQAYVNARITDASLRRRTRLAGLYRDTLERFSLVAAQDPRTARNLTTLGARDVLLTRSLKSAAEPLSADPDALTALQGAIGSRQVWVAASTHPEDEGPVIAAHHALLADRPDLLLILTPRLPARADEISRALEAEGLRYARRSRDNLPEPQDQVLLADSFGELGLWYRLAQVVFVGASFGGLGGHNPWEAICLSVPVVHGPDTMNFTTDYEILDAEGLARMVTPDDLAAALQEMARQDIHNQAGDLISEARAALDPLVQRLLALMDGATQSDRRMQ